MSTIKVKMFPHISEVAPLESGINAVIRAYFKHMPKFGIQFVAPDTASTKYDIHVVHAGMKGSDCDVCSLHGLYWTADYTASKWEYNANAKIVQAIMSAKEVTVPSEWVAQTIRRDVRINPTVVPHGIDVDEWKHNRDDKGYILAYAKNRVGDVCDPSFIPRLAKLFPNRQFVCTFAPNDSPSNVTIIGTVPHDQMKLLVQHSAVVVSPVKETFGILNLEAMASSKPVLGYAYGGNKELIKHGVTGYLAQPWNVDDLALGLDYCLANRKQLGENGREIARYYTWDKACEILAKVFARAAMKDDRPYVIDSSLYLDKGEQNDKE